MHYEHCVKDSSKEEAEWLEGYRFLLASPLKPSEKSGISSVDFRLAPQGLSVAPIEFGMLLQTGNWVDIIWAS